MGLIDKDLDKQYHAYVTLNFTDGTTERIRVPLWADIEVSNGVLKFSTHHGYENLTGQMGVPVEMAVLKSWRYRWEAQGE